MGAQPRLGQARARQACAQDGARPCSAGGRRRREAMKGHDAPDRGAGTTLDERSQPPSFAMDMGRCGPDRAPHRNRIVVYRCGAVHWAQLMVHQRIYLTAAPLPQQRLRCVRARSTADRKRRGFGRAAFNVPMARGSRATCLAYGNLSVDRRGLLRSGFTHRLDI